MQAIPSPSFAKIPTFHALRELELIGRGVHRRVIMQNGERTYQMEISAHNQKKTHNLFHALVTESKSFTHPNSSLASRVHDMADQIEEVLLPQKGTLSSDVFYKMVTAISSKLISIKILVHIDAALTSVYALMQKRLKAFEAFGYSHQQTGTEESLNAKQAVDRAIAAMPKLLTLITLNERDFSFQLNISELTRDFTSFNYDQTANEFDQAMLDIASLFTFDPASGIITTNAIIPKTLVMKMMCSADKAVELIGQLLFVCRICQQEVFEEDLQYLMAQPLLLQLCPFQMQMGRYLFPTTSTQKPPRTTCEVEEKTGPLPWAQGKEQSSAPFLRTLIMKRDAYVAQHKPFITVLLSPADCEDFTGYEANEPCSYYDLVLRIEKVVARFLPPHLKPQGDSDRGIKGLLEHITPLLNESTFKTNWKPIDMDGNGFCPSAETLHQVISNFSSLCKITEDPHPSPVLVQPMKKKGTAQNKKTSLLPQKVTSLPDDCMPIPQAQTETAVTPSLPDPMTASLQTTQVLKASLNIADRVSVWFHPSDKKAGIRARGMIQENPFIQEKMLITHRFPEDILLLSLNPHFSKKTAWKHNLEHTLYQSCILIDEKKYILEATVDAKEILYHLCAKPIAKWQDYFLPSSEFPSLSQDTKYYAKTPQVSPLTTKLSWMENGNIQFPFEDRRYELIRLYTPLYS